MPYCHFKVFSKDKDFKLKEEDKLCIHPEGIVSCEDCIVYKHHHAFLNPSSRCIACLQVKKEKVLIHPYLKV
jgi:hypothetical protein